MRIKLIRGDTKKIKVRLLDSNDSEIYLGANDQLYFTVKTSSLEEEASIRKSIGNGITYSNGYYHITIDSTDTDSLDYGTYKYDIELVTDLPLTRTLVYGNFLLLNEVTFRGNEV